MKKKISPFIILFFILLQPVSFALETGEYAWRGYSIQLVEIQEKPMFAPAGMKDDERAVALKLKVPEALTDDKALSHALYESACLRDESSKVYKPGAATIKDNILTYLFAIPRTLDIRTLTLSFEEEAAGSLAAHLGKWSEADRRFTLPGNITRDSTMDDIIALLGENNTEQETITEGISILSKKDGPSEAGKMLTGYIFRHEELICFIHAYSDNSGSEEERYGELCTALSGLHGEANYADSDRVSQCIAALGVQPDMLDELEAAPWCAWMLPDQNTLVFTGIIQGVGVLCMNVARLLK